jgi:hypothetical protein
MRRWLPRILIVVVVLASLAGLIRVGMIWNKTRDVLPTMTPVPPGPRAPAWTVLGSTVGRTSLDDVQERASRAGWSCRDTSMRALMKNGREDAQKRIAEAKERGEDPDTVSGASRAYYYSKKEQNPQVQLTCEKVDLHSLSDVYPEGSMGDAVFIFDSVQHPLRYVVTSRAFMTQAAAVAAFDEAESRWSAALGPTTSSVGEPNTDPSKKAFARMLIVRRDWTFADRHGIVSALNFGPAKGIDVRELWEVPWPTVVEP